MAFNDTFPRPAKFTTQFTNSVTNYGSNDSPAVETCTIFGYKNPLTSIEVLEGGWKTAGCKADKLEWAPKSLVVNWMRSAVNSLVKFTCST